MSRFHSRGIPLMLTAVAVFSLMDASLKQLTGTYPPSQVSCIRGLASIPIMLLAVGWRGEWRRLVPQRWSAHVARGVLAVGVLSLFVYALQTLPLTETYAIFLCAPLIVTALSALLLHEHVDWHRWLAVVLGLLGVLIMLRPSASRFVSVGAAAALGAALCYSLSAITIRTLSSSESTLSVAFSFVVVVGFVNGVIALPHWVPVQPAHWPWILLIGITGALGQMLLIQAFRVASPARVAPFEYTALLWGLTFDWVLWRTLPDQRTLLGGGIVTASGLYVIYREHLRSTVAVLH